MSGQTLNLSRFIPKFILSLFSGNSLYNNSYLLGQRGPIWISVTEPYDLYNRIAELRAVIDRDATMFSGMQIYKRDKKTKERIEDPILDKLLDNPNCTQSQNQFLKQYRAQFITYGNQFIYRNKTNSGTYPVALWCISPYYLQPVLGGKLFDQISMDGIITGYRMINTISLGSSEYTKGFQPEDILYTRMPDLNNPIIGKSPLAALKYPLSNIEQAYKASNVAMQHVGVGIVSPETSKDMGGSMPLSSENRKHIEQQFQNDYGINEGQRRTILSNAAVKFDSMAVDNSKLLLKEEISADLATICNILHVNPQIFISDTTYENLKSAIVQTYQDNIIPAAEEFMQALSPFVGLKPNEELYASFDHLSILKENKLKGMEAINTVVTALTEAVHAGLISGPQAESILAAELGIAPAESEEDRSLNRINRLSPLVANNVLESLTPDEKRDLIGYDTIEGGNKLVPPTSKPPEPSK